MSRERKYSRRATSCVRSVSTGPARPRGQRAQALGERLVDRLEHPALAVAVQRRARRAVRLGRKENEVHRADAEGRGGPREERLELGDDLRGARQRARGLVEELELGVAATLGEVGPVCRHQQDRGRDEEQAALGPGGHDGRDCQREAGVAERDGPVGEQHVEALLRLELALGDGRPRRRRRCRRPASPRTRRRRPRPRRSGRAGRAHATKPSSTNSATQVPSVNWARLKNALKTGISRSKASASADPTRPASTSSWAGRNSRPATSGSSPSDSEWVLRRKWRCTTHALRGGEARARRATTGCRPSSGRRAKRLRPGSRYATTVASATTPVRSQILALSPSCRRIPITRLLVEVHRAPEADPAEAHPLRIDLAARVAVAVAAEARPASSWSRTPSRRVAEAGAPEARPRPVGEAGGGVDAAVRREAGVR